MMLEAGGVSLNDRLQRGVAAGPRQRQFVGERLEVQIVAVAAAVHAEAEHHRHLEDRAEQERRARERRRLAEEGRRDGRLAGARAVGEQGRERAFVQVKSRATPAVFNDYVERFRAYEGCSRMFFVCHSPTAALNATTPPEGVDLWRTDTLAEKALRAGLFDWLIERVR